MTMYGAELAEVYDQCYRGRGKDYVAESALVVEQIRARRGASPADTSPSDTTPSDTSLLDISLLDIACGTGAHLRHLAELCRHVEGLELSADMLAVAKAELPEIPLHQGDMRDFLLDARFDAISCMFSSIGHMVDQSELDSAIRGMARHLRPGGVIVLEPWWFPERFLPGYVAADIVRVGDRSISRVSHSTAEAGRTRVEVHYTVAEPESIKSFVDIHHITLFRREQYEAAFAAAGCSVDYVEGEPAGRGLFVATR